MRRASFNTADGYTCVDRDLYRDITDRREHIMDDNRGYNRPLILITGTNHA